MKKEIQKIRETFFQEFNEKEQWIIFFCGVLLALLTAIAVYCKPLYSISMGITIGVLGYYAALLHRKLSILATNIDLQIRKADREKQQIARALEKLINMAQQKDMKRKVRNSLVSVVGFLTEKGIEDKTIRHRVLEALMGKPWKKTVSVSTYGLPGAWMDPYWFSYLSLQIGRAAELKGNSVKAKRYFIYKKKLVTDYSKELSLLIEAHSNYVQPFLFFAEDIGRELNGTELTLRDFTYIEYNDGKDTIVWRNPENNGEVEEVTNGAKKQIFIDLMKLLEEKETSLNMIGIVG